MSILTSFINFFGLREPRPIQEIFNIVIENKLYGNGLHAVPFMCLAVERGRIKGLITEKERNIALKAVEDYLKSSRCTLYRKLDDNNLPSDLDDCLAIYQDWDNRPILKH